MSANFLLGLQMRYPDQFHGILPDHIDIAYERVLMANMTWSDTISNYSLSNASKEFSQERNITSIFVKSNDANGGSLSRTSDKNSNMPYIRGSGVNSVSPVASSMQKEEEEEEAESVLLIIAFVFHKISLTISVILVLWVSVFILTSPRSHIFNLLSVNFFGFSFVVLLLFFGKSINNSNFYESCQFIN